MVFVGGIGVRVKQEDIIMLSFSNADKNMKRHRYTLSKRLTVELSLEQFCSVVRHFSLRGVMERMYKAMVGMWRCAVARARANLQSRLRPYCVQFYNDRP